MNNETTQKTDPVLTLGEQVAQGLLALKEPHGDQKCIELKAAMSHYATAVDEETAAQAGNQTARENNKESSRLLTVVVNGVLATLTLERSELVAKLQFGPADGADDQTRLIAEVLKEDGGKSNLALVHGLERAAARKHLDGKTLDQAAAQLEAATTQVVDAKLELQSLIAGDRLYLSKRAPPGHPARDALKRKTRPPTRDPVKVAQAEKARLEKEQAKQARAQARSDARLARDREKFERAQARLQASFGLLAPAPRLKSA